MKLVVIIFIFTFFANSCNLRNTQYSKVVKPEEKAFVTKIQDDDKDGVLNYFDKCKETPEGARIDGSGCALDTDLDGVIDLYDKCVLLIGLPSDDGCSCTIGVGY